MPSGTLGWTKSYLWRAFVKDATTEVTSPYSTLLANVPQPEVTAKVSSAPDGLQDQDFDPQTGNYTTVRGGRHGRHGRAAAVGGQDVQQHRPTP